MKQQMYATQQQRCEESWLNKKKRLFCAAVKYTVRDLDGQTAKCDMRDTVSERARANAAKRQQLSKQIDIDLVISVNYSFK